MLQNIFLQYIGLRGSQISKKGNRHFSHTSPKNLPVLLNFIAEFTYESTVFLQHLNDHKNSNI